MRSVALGFKLSSKARLQLHSGAQMKAQTREILLAERKCGAWVFCQHWLCQTQVPPFLCYIFTVSSSLLSLNQALSSCFLLHCCCSTKKTIGMNRVTVCLNWFCCCILHCSVLSGWSDLSHALVNLGLSSATKTTQSSFPKWCQRPLSTPNSFAV